MAKGCTSGHGVSGVSGLSLRGIVATVVYIEVGVLFAPGRQPLTGGIFSQKQTEDFDYKLIVGAILFGIGWGLSGFIPGAAFASLRYSGSASVIFLISMLVGMRITPLLNGLLDSFDTTK